MKTALLLMVLALAACGVAGPPQPPGSGVEVGGEIRIGVMGEL